MANRRCWDTSIPARWSCPSGRASGPGTKYAIVGKVRDGGYILFSGDVDAKWYKVYTQAGTFRGYMSANKILRMESPQF